MQAIRMLSIRCQFVCSLAHLHNKIAMHFSFVSDFISFFSGPHFELSNAVQVAEKVSYPFAAQQVLTAECQQNKCINKEIIVSGNVRATPTPQPRPSKRSQYNEMVKNV